MQSTIARPSARAQAFKPCSRSTTRTHRLVVRATPEEQAAAAAPVQASTNVCRTCGVDLSNKSTNGCDREGRVIGGLGAMPGFGWWPIKAYRPCPALSEAGMEYTRKGQALNDVLFGGVSLNPDSVKSLETLQKTADRGLDIEM